MSYGIMRMEKAKSFGEITHKELHNVRGKEVRNADGTKNIEVQGMRGVSQYIKKVEKALDKQNGRKTRKDAVRCMEFVFTSDKAFFDKVDYKTYFEECDKWLASTFGAENVLQKCIHLDESTPHVHVLVAPVYEGKFNCKHWVSGKQSLRVLQDSFHASVQHLGLERGNPKDFTKEKHESALQFAEDVAKAKEYLSQLSQEELVNYAIKGFKAKEQDDKIKTLTKTVNAQRVIRKAMVEHYVEQGKTAEEAEAFVASVVKNHVKKQQQRTKQQAKQRDNSDELER